MKRALITAVMAALALSSLAGSPALAQGWDQHRDAPRHQDRDDRWHEHHWRAGDRLPPEYLGGRYVIVKPALYHLHRPPRGHQWVRVGSDAVLVVTGTGVVIEWAPGLFR